MTQDTKRAKFTMMKDNSGNGTDSNKAETCVAVNFNVPALPSTSIVPIATLTPKLKVWRIRAKVTLKSDKKRYDKGKSKGCERSGSKKKGSQKKGKVFDIILSDESGEIKCTGFNDEVDKYFDMLQKNKVYYFSKCTVKAANKRYSPVKGDYELTMNAGTVIEPCNDDADLPTMTFDFVQISELMSHKAFSTIDVIGIVTVCKEPTCVTGKNKKIKKCNLLLRDQSGMAVDLTLWGNDAPKFKVRIHSVIAVKGARVSEFNGRSLSVNARGQLFVNPNIPETASLRSWFKNGGRTQQFTTFLGEGESAGDEAPTK